MLNFITYTAMTTAHADQGMICPYRFAATGADVALATVDTFSVRFPCGKYPCCKDDRKEKKHIERKDGNKIDCHSGWGVTLKKLGCGWKIRAWFILIVPVNDYPPPVHLGSLVSARLKSPLPQIIYG